MCTTLSMEEIGMEVITLQNYGHQEGYMTEQCVIFASKEQVKEILAPHVSGSTYTVNYEETVALLVDAGITVMPVIGFAADAFNGEVSDMSNMKEYAPWHSFHNRPIMDLDPLEDIVARGRDRLEDNGEEE